MKNLRSILAAITISTCLTTTGTLAQTTSPLTTEISSLDTQISEAEETISRHEGGLIRILAETRRETLLLLRAVVETHQQAKARGVTTEVVVPTVEPDPTRAKQLLGEMASAQERVAEAERDAAGTGGLIQALALSRVETEKLALAQLQMAYLQARYGIAFPALPSATDTGSREAERPASATTDKEATDPDAAGALPWADPDHPDIDYSLAPFELAHRENERISGWWTIKEERAAIDDSPKVLAVNYSAYKPRSYGGITALITQCKEGETSFVFIQDEYLSTKLQSYSYDIIYRIDDDPAQSTRWTELTSNKGAGLFGPSSETFLRSLYHAEKFFIRLTEGDGQQHDAQFDLSGIQETADIVAAACGWSTLELTRDDYRAIQTMLNAGGFDTGTPDGFWGSGSQNAMRAFQQANGLPATGTPDRATLKALGVQPGN